MSAPSRPPTVLTNAVVHTMVDGARPADAIAWRDGKVLAVGDERVVREMAGPNAHAIDMAGRTVTPGFVDAHHHFTAAVVGASAIDFTGQSPLTIADMVVQIREASTELPADAWVLAAGYDEHALEDRRHPTRDDLDAADIPNPILLMHYSHHEGIVCSRGLARLGIDRHTSPPKGGIIVKDSRGEPNGRLVETAVSRARQLAEDSLLARDELGVLLRMGAYQDRLFEKGITRICDPTVPLEMELLYRRARQEGHLDLPVVMMPIGSQGALLPPWDRVGGPPTGEGPEDLRRGPLKLFFDGGNRCALCMTAGQALRVTLGMIGGAIRSGSLGMLRTSQDVKPRWGSDRRLRTGVTYMSRDESKKLVRAACERGFSVAVHALGNDAVTRALDALGDARVEHRDVPPPRIEHASIITADLAKRAADLGIMVVSQPQFLELPIFDSMPRIPGFRMMAHRTLLDAGVRVAGSSDAPVTGFDPLVAMRSAVGRRTRSGAILQQDEGISPAEALLMYTREAARAAGSLDVAGTLEPGKRADLSVLSHDPTSGIEELERARVVQTVLAGETVFDASETSGARALADLRRSA